MIQEIYSVPMEFRVLIVLKILAKNHNCDTLNECSFGRCIHMQQDFFTFLVNFALLYFEHLIFMPEGKQLQKTIDILKILGFNGCFGSIDCTLLRWNKCPREWQHS